MKKPIQLIMIIQLALLIALSCNNVNKKEETNTEKEVEVTRKNETNENNKTNGENKIKSDKNEHNGIIAIENIKKGDKIEGLEVTKVDYKPGDHFSIQLDGEFSTKGKLQYNEFEDAFSFYVEKNLVPQTKILVEGNEYDFYKILNFSNRDKVKKILNKKQLQNFNAGKFIPLTVVVDNLSVGIKMDKGQLGVGRVNFVKLKQ